MLKSIDSGAADKNQSLEIKLVRDKMSDAVIRMTKEMMSESEKYFRIKLINSLAGIRQVALIGTKSKEGQENVAIFNSVIHLGANPPLFGFISRPDVVERDTLENIRETGSYTINLIDKKWIKEAHQTSARYPKNISEFEAVGFTPEYLLEIFPPFVKEADIKIEMKFEQILNIEINNTIMVIGSIESIQIPEKRLSEDGLVNPDNLLLSGGLDAYYSSQFLEQLPYAKPK
ncbi:flavin reductase family protein [Kaistella jeonii]|nr:flavin reductase family protein [Kaistella jeonii]SFC10498.1 NADH-FMN oxidoreductase RutF, flavin reductase (DIM6/NTAB) family [Kaistella jeonii]VEI95282.1 Flavin reductase like domain [Kaistella jeonii]